MSQTENNNIIPADALLLEAALTVYKCVQDGTWDEKDVLAFFRSTIKEQSEPAQFHKNQLEGLIHHTEELLDLQRIFFSTKKGLPACKAKEDLVRKMINTLKMRYNTDRFKTKSIQQKLR